jgi:hypothetical protein
LRFGSPALPASGQFWHGRRGPSDPWQAGAAACPSAREDSDPVTHFVWTGTANDMKKTLTINPRPGTRLTIPQSRLSGSSLNP